MFQNAPRRISVRVDGNVTLLAATSSNAHRPMVVMPSLTIIFVIEVR
jgi:hypothetical protein